MALSKSLLAVILLLLLFEKYAEGTESASSNNNDDTSSIPMIASGKRQHNIMRFGKRPAGGHNLIHFGKREDSRPQHSFLSFGKRTSEQASLPDIIQYLQKTNDKSYKRGHAIMRFGKRTPSDQEIMAYESGDDNDDDYDEYYTDGEDIDEDKRGGHNMMYFGKRGGHSMLYFGKRAGGHNMMSFGKRAAGHNMMSFGKRAAGHNMMSFGKRAAGHNMMSFGKRAGGHKLLSFGKRDYDDEDDMDDLSPEEKRAHSMIHFGKREDDDDAYPDMDIKRAAHSMIHFGKREYDIDSLPYWNPNTYDKKQHNLLRFGKKMDGMRKGSHAMIHFGKRDDDKRAHSMIHFGKRSLDQKTESASNNQSENGPSQPASRVKRDVEEPSENSEPLVVYTKNLDDMSPDEDLENVIKVAEPSMYRADELMDRLSYPVDEMAFYPSYQPAQKKEASKNVFLRFG